jgi:hypothetical protein
MGLLRTLVLLAIPAAAIAAEEPNEFTRPVQLCYSDPGTVAPMMGPCLPVDFDDDGLWEALAGVDRGQIYYFKESLR